ncbi:MAG: hypothetical protein LJE85_13810 [Gammaproteobacteria bacterium]|jgi:hypothetical protein|nr:hypothetical protein [Gammaproteobacteria bacterium]
MHTRRFFVVALLLPLLLIMAGFVAALVNRSGLYTHLILTLLIPYAVFTLATAIISRNYPPNALRRFGFRSPILFLFLLIGYLGLEYAFDLSLASDPTGLVAIMIFSATYIVIFGYLYILILQQALISYIYQQRQKRTYISGVLHIDGKAFLPL